MRLSNFFKFILLVSGEFKFLFFFVRYVLKFVVCWVCVFVRKLEWIIC